MDRERVLLYDGVCGLCDATVRFILKHDRSRTMQFAPLQSDYAQRLIKRHPGLDQVDSLILVEAGFGDRERIWIRSNAVLRIADYLGGVWRLALIFKIVPRFLRDAVYNLIARYRYRVFGRLTECSLPTAQEHARFLN
jgi:predicted DCC family thiol-disulfide oxidoreductase YuxK